MARTVYTVTSYDEKGRPTTEITLGDPKSARLVVEKYKASGQATTVTKSERN